MVPTAPGRRWPTGRCRGRTSVPLDRQFVALRRGLWTSTTLPSACLRRVVFMPTRCFQPAATAGGESQRVDPGMLQLQIPPEQPAEGVGQPDQGDVVDADLAFPEIVDQQIAHRPALDAAAVDELFHAELTLVGQRPHGRRRGVAEHAEGVQHLVEVRALVVSEESQTSAATSSSSRQSPVVMSATAPPLAAMMTAIRCSATRVVDSPTGLAWHRAVSSANPTGSRVRAISAASRFGVAVVSSQARPGRITSAHINDSRPVPNTMVSNLQSHDVVGLAPPDRQPLASRPGRRGRRRWPATAAARCRPAVSAASPATIRTPRRRLSSPADGVARRTAPSPAAAAT